MSYVGKKVRIIDDGYSYSGYTEMAEKLGLTKFGLTRKYNFNNLTGFVTSQGNHPISGILLLGVDFGDTEIIIENDKKCNRVFTLGYIFKRGFFNMSYVGRKVECKGTGYRYSGYTEMAETLGLTKWDMGGDKSPVGMIGTIVAEHPHLSATDRHKILVGVDFGSFESIFGIDGNSLEFLPLDLFNEDFTL